MPTPCPQPRPVTTTTVAARAEPAASSARLQRDRHAVSLGRTVERVDRLRLSECIRAAEEGLLQLADRAAEVVRLEPVAIRALDIDPLADTPALQEHSRLVDPPWRPNQDSPVRADRLQSLPERNAERAVDLREDAARENEGSGQTHVDPAWPEHLVRRSLHGLASEKSRAADAVAADVHERSAR